MTTLPHALSSYPILVVDDEPMNLVVFEFNFVPEFTLRLASSAEEALRILESGPIAVFIADHRMPGMLGLDLLSIVQARAPTVVRILLTAHGDMPLLLDAVNRGTLFRFVAKPWDAVALRQDMMLAIERHVAATRAAGVVRDHAAWSSVAVGAALAASQDAGLAPDALVLAARRWTATALQKRERTSVPLLLELARARTGAATELTVTTAPDLPDVDVDVAMPPLLDAISALVDNAGAAGTGIVRIHASVLARGEVSLRISDDGPGLPGTLSTPFQEGRDRAGLGLPAAHGIVTGLGGRLVMTEGAPGEVTILLPPATP